MKKICKLLDIIHIGLTKKDYDGVYLVCGEEGTGKSNLNLAMLDYWSIKIYGKCVVEDIKHVCLDREEFVTDLKDAKKYEMTIDDEAGDISSKRTMSTFQVQLNQAYQVIRGDNLLTLLTIPSPFDLDGFFVKRRAKGLFYVKKRGYVKFYNREALRKIIELNQNRMVKRIELVRATFIDTFGIYKGVLAAPYMNKKTKKMAEVRKKLHEEIVGVKENKNAGRDNIIINMKNNGLTDEEISRHVGVSRSRVTQIVSTSVNC